MLSRLFKFLKTDIWHISSRQLSGKKSFFLRQLKMIVLAARGVFKDRLQLQASALTFFTLMAIVPVFALVFAIAKGFGFETTLEQRLLEDFPGQEEVMMQVVTFAQNLLQRTRGGMMAGIGIIMLFWATINVLGHIEQSFNDIWNIKKPRTIWRKFSDYLTIMVISPVLALLAGSVTIYVKSQVVDAVENVSILGGISPLIFMALKLLPFVMAWIAFTLIYLLMPNTKVRFTSGLLAGLIAGIFYQLLQLAYLNFQFVIAKYNAIYGSFAALPLFLIWLNLSWLIVLFGAEICFAHQKIKSFEYDPFSRQISFATRKLIALVVSHAVVQRFITAGTPYTLDEIAARMEAPIRLIQKIVADLTESGILSEVDTGEPDEPAYQPAVDTSLLSMAYVVDALEKLGSDTVPVLRTEETRALSASLEGFQSAMKQSPDNLLLKDLK